MKLISIYNGNFQPPTKAHHQVYKRLKQITGPDTFVVTTDRTPTQDAPLNFGDKEQILVRHGVPSNNIVKVQDWKHPVEIFNNFSPNQTKVIFALNNKEASEIYKRKTEPSEVVWLNKDGKPSYFQPYKGNENTMKPLSKHGYVLIVDDTKIEGRPISTGNIRQVLGSPKFGDNEKKKFFRFIFGWFDVGLYTLMNVKFKMAHQVSVPDEVVVGDKDMSQPSTSAPQSPVPVKNVKEKIQELVREILGEIMDEDYSSEVKNGQEDSFGMDDTMGKTDAQKRSDVQKQKVTLVQQKKEAEAEAKKNKQQRDQYATTIKSYDSFQKKNDRAAIDAINKQLSQPIPPTSPIK